MKCRDVGLFGQLCFAMFVLHFKIHDPLIPFPKKYALQNIFLRYLSIYK